MNPGIFNGLTGNVLLFEVLLFEVFQLEKRIRRAVLKNVHLRIARPTQHLTALVEMYCAGLGYKEIGGFEGHDGYDGIMLGHDSLPYHFEFTFEEGAPAHVPSLEELLVFYVAKKADWESRCNDLANAGFKQVPSKNPYWDVSGRTFTDVDGYRIVIQHSTWSPTVAAEN